MAQSARVHAPDSKKEERPKGRWLVRSRSVFCFTAHSIAHSLRRALDCVACGTPAPS